MPPETSVRVGNTLDVSAPAAPETRKGRTSSSLTGPAVTVVAILGSLVKVVVVEMYVLQKWNYQSKAT